MLEFKVFFTVVLLCGVTAIALGAGLLLALVTAWFGQVPAIVAAAFVSEKTHGHNFSE
jgi:CHASE2 domain-containing sensor protein